MKNKNLGWSSDTWWTTFFTNDEHPQKAESPIEVTEERIITCVNDEHLCYVSNKTRQHDILVENMGRTSYGKDFFMIKGIIQKVLLDGKVLKNW